MIGSTSALITTTEVSYEITLPQINSPGMVAGVVLGSMADEGSGFTLKNVNEVGRWRKGSESVHNVPFSVFRII